MAEYIDDSAERTEPATPRKREETRKKGIVAKSIEINSAGALFFGILILYFAGANIVSHSVALATSMFQSAGHATISIHSFQQMFLENTVVFFSVLSPVLVGLMVIGLVASISQVGWKISAEALAPKWKRLNPFVGVKNIFMSKRALAELVKNFLKIIIVGWITYAAVAEAVEQSVLLVDGEVSAIALFMVRTMISTGLKAGLAYMALAVLDFGYQKYEFEKELMMTKEEVKEETKMQEGDPLVKGRIRSIQRQIAYKRMMHEVPKADVVVTNPTHIAVALKYEAQKMNAPKVVAKGAELIAERIKEIAREAGVPIVEDKMLARALYKSVDVGEEIPEKLFQAVAQVLAYIYRLRQQKLVGF
ncbi:MAG: flagellar biosynthesis protein FlhB [Bacteroidetes bacterium]|nr:flagellar biosynthesis protein FlhB [Bacteroidota bacterium]